MFTTYNSIQSVTNELKGMFVWDLTLDYPMNFWGYRILLTGFSSLKGL